MQATFNAQTSISDGVANLHANAFADRMSSPGQPASMQTTQSMSVRQASYNHGSRKTTFTSETSSRNRGGFTQTVVSQQFTSFSRGPGSMFVGYNAGFNQCRPDNGHRGSPFGHASFDNDGHRGQSSHSQGSAAQNAWSDSSQGNGTATIKGPGFTLNFNKSDSSMTVDTADGQSKVWGDPHYDQNIGTASHTSTMFSGNKTIPLANGATADIITKPGAGNQKVSYANTVVVKDANGKTMYVVNNLDQQDKNSQLSVQKLGNAQGSGYSQHGSHHGGHRKLMHA